MPTRSGGGGGGAPARKAAGRKKAPAKRGTFLSGPNSRNSSNPTKAVAKQLAKKSAATTPGTPAFNRARGIKKATKKAGGSELNLTRKAPAKKAAPAKKTETRKRTASGRLSNAVTNPAVIESRKKQNADRAARRAAARKLERDTGLRN